jgi:hypothetical protein
MKHCYRVVSLLLDFVGDRGDIFGWGLNGHCMPCRGLVAVRRLRWKSPGPLRVVESGLGWENDGMTMEIRLAVEEEGRVLSSTRPSRNLQSYLLRAG